MLGVAGKYKPLQPGWVGLMSIALSTAAIMEVSAMAKNVSGLFPSFAYRAQKHVHAGAEWERISRLSDMYRAELHAMKPGKVLHGLLRSLPLKVLHGLLRSPYKVLWSVEGPFLLRYNMVC